MPIKQHQHFNILRKPVWETHTMQYNANVKTVQLSETVVLWKPLVGWVATATFGLGGRDVTEYFDVSRFGILIGMFKVAASCFKSKA